MVELRDYQHLAVDYLREHKQAGLFLDMGLGKTAVVLSALEPRHLPVLVVAPKRVAESVWEEERDLWRPDLSIAVAAGTAAEREAALRAGADITVISRDNFGLVTELRKPKMQYKTLVVDELSGFKTKTSVRWRTARRIINWHGVENVWGLTGTPVSNGYMDLWGQIALLDGGERLTLNMGSYQNRYFTPGRQLANGTIYEWHLKPEAEANIWKKIEDICLSMETEGRVSLPPITYNEVKVKMGAKAVRAYREIRDTLVTDLREVFDGGDIHSASSRAILTMKLGQLSAGFIYDDDAELTGEYTNVHTAKLDALKEICEAATSPVLVFYRFTPERERILEAIPGAESINAKNAIKRWNEGEIPVMVAHPQSAGHGLNLQRGGHTVVWTTLPWSLEDWEQANKRVFRSGQTHPVVVHKLMVPGSVDYLTEASLAGKAMTQDAMLAYLESPI